MIQFLVRHLFVYFRLIVAADILIIKAGLCCGIRLWQDTNYDIVPELCLHLVAYTVHSSEAVRQATALALAAALAKHLDQVPAVLQELLELYRAKLFVSTSMR